MDRIGKYVILEKIGQGAMGEVYRGRDSVIGRDVAIKVIQDSALNTSDIKERFYREARSAGRLSHENITTIYDVGEDDGRPFIVMEYLEGTDLRTMLDPAAGHSSEEKLDVAIQICQGLHFAHQHSIIHRDIKPDNVRVLPSGRIKIMDFGIARIQDDTEIQTMTLSGMSVGTPRYMSPEQIRGEKLDARSDIFSFGVLFYELLSGTPPFFGDRVATIIYMILNVDPEPFEFDPKAVSTELQPILFKCLAKDKDDRYNDCTEILRDLQSVLRLTAELGQSQKSQILAATITDFLTKDAATRTGESVRQPEEVKAPETSKRSSWIVAGISGLAVIMATSVVLVLANKSNTIESTDGVQSDAVVSSVSPGADPEGENQQHDAGEGVDNVNPDEQGEIDNSSQTSVQRTGDAGRVAADQTSAVQQPAKIPDQIGGGERTVEIVQENRLPALEDDAGLENRARSEDERRLDSRARSEDEAADPNDGQIPQDPTEANAARTAMRDAKGAVLADMQQHPAFLAALRLEEEGNDAFGSGNFDIASELYKRSTIGFVDTVSIRSELDSVIESLVQRLDLGYGRMNLDELRGVHEFYASDYYATLFSIAVELSAATSATGIRITTQGASAVVSTQFYYKNNKNDEIPFERSENWAFQEVDQSWNLVDVEDL